eukprot:gene4335-4588_t
MTSSAIAKPSSYKVAAVRKVPAMRSSTVLQRQQRVAAVLTSSSSFKARSAIGLASCKQQQQRPSQQAGFKPWKLPLAAGAIAFHLTRLAVSHIMNPRPIAHGGHPAAAPVANMRVFPGLLLKRGNGGGLGGPAAPGGRKPALLWFRNDLRLHDHEPLAAANAAATSLLPVYIFDPREYGKASLGAVWQLGMLDVRHCICKQQSVNGFDKTGPYRARFILEALADLRRRLRDAGSDLLVRLGKPEDILPQLVSAVGAGAVYCHGEVTQEEVGVEAAVSRALDKAGAALKVLWGGTLFHVNDLPFKLPSMPPNYSDFRAKLAGLAVRSPADAPAQLKGLPAASVECGEIPTLRQLGFDAATLSRSDSAPAVRAAGQESDAGMQWLLFELLWRDFFRFVTMKYTQTGIGQKLKKGGGLAHMPLAAVPA